MKGRLLIVLLFFIGILIKIPVQAQDITGIWRGYFITEAGENYRLEVQLNLNPSKSTTGVSYSYLDVRFYGKATMTGHYDKSTKELKIQELKTVEVRNSGGGGTCIMNYKLNYAQSGKEEFLEGTYIGKQENVPTAKWGDCGGGKVFLRRVTTSDFYLEPFLKDKELSKKSDEPVTKPETNVEPKKTITKNTIAKAPVKKPAINKAATSKPTVKAPVKKVPETRNVIVGKTDSIAKPKMVIVTPKKLTIKPVTIPQQTRSRENNLLRTIDVSSREVTIKIYDNGEIDDDTVSVYLDNRLVIASKRITDKPLTYTFQVTEEEPEHIVTMVAENLGRIPPNTSLMIVNDGDKRYEVFISTNEQKNAVIRFRYKKPDE